MAEGRAAGKPLNKSEALNLTFPVREPPKAARCDPAHHPVAGKSYFADGRLYEHQVATDDLLLHGYGEAVTVRRPTPRSHALDPPAGKAPVRDGGIVGALLQSHARGPYEGPERDLALEPLAGKAFAVGADGQGVAALLPHTLAAVDVHAELRSARRAEEAAALAAERKQLATQRAGAAERQRQPHSFHRKKALPPDEQAVVGARLGQQREEWRRILRRQRGQPSDVKTFATRVTEVPAGDSTSEVVRRLDRTQCAAYGKMALCIVPGESQPRGAPPPFSARLPAPSEVADRDDRSQHLTARTGRDEPSLERLSYLMRLGTRM